MKEPVSEIIIKIPMEIQSEFENKYTSKLSTTFDDDVEVSLASAEIDALIPSRNCFVPCAEIDDVRTRKVCGNSLFYAVMH